MDDYEELLHVISTKKDIIKFLNEKNSIKCDDIEKYTISKNIIGEGSRGKIYKQKIKNKEYAVKKFPKEVLDMNVRKFFNTKEISLESIADFYFNRKGIDKDFIIALNGGDKSVILKNYKAPPYSDPIVHTLKYRRFDTHEKIKSEGYFFLNESHVEYIISVMCSDFLKKGISINFLDAFGFTTCKNKKNIINDYFFMELINNNLDNIDECLLEKNFFQALTIQLFHALAVCQTLKINHNDLSYKNIFLKYIDKDTEFNGEKLITADYFHYSIRNKNIYLPYVPFIVKMGDYSLSAKYKYPMVTNAFLLLEGYSQNDENKAVPNWYSTYYDIVVFVMNAALSYKNFNFMENLADFVLGIGKNEKLWEKKIIEIVGGTSSFRPNVNILEKKFSHVSPESVLFNKNIYGEFLKTPPAGKKIITLGKI